MTTLRKQIICTNALKTQAFAAMLVFTGAVLIQSAPAAICAYLLAGDLNHDCKVDLADVSLLAANWLTDCTQSPLDPACVDNTDQAQRMQFALIENGLEMFRHEFGIYPPSEDNQFLDFPPAPGSDPNTYLGTSKLAEALLGMDLMGFHPYSRFRSDGLGWLLLNNVMAVYTGTPENIAQRKGPFIPVDASNACRMDDIFEDTGSFSGSTLVLCDVFEKPRHSGKRTGMPILYLRARTEYLNQDCTNGIEDDIYYYPDMQALLELGSADDQSVPHPLCDGINDWQDFENMILNPNITVTKRPCRADSFILISAGPDGLYGTRDDVFNFDR
jgi:hypothetical protein